MSCIFNLCLAPKPERDDRHCKFKTQRTEAESGGETVKQDFEYLTECFVRNSTSTLAYQEEKKMMSLER